MIQPAFEILNQRGTPMFFSDVFANRPTAAIVGRIFISTDTKEFYRDTGTNWELIGGPGTGTITGSGTNNVVPKFTGSSTIGDSNIVLSSGGTFVNTAIGSTSGVGNTYDNLQVLAVTESTLNLNTGGGFNTAFFNSIGNLGLLASYSSPSVNNYLFYYAGASLSNRYLAFQTEGVDRLIIQQTGNVSVGDNFDYGYKFYVNGTIGTANSITIGEGGTGLSRLRALSGADLVFNAGGDRMVVRQTGNVGINTLSPAYRLDVNGSGNATTLYENGVRVLTTSNISGTTNYLPKFTGANTIGNSDFFNQSGNLITSSSTYIYSNAASGGTTIDAGLRIDGTNKYVSFWTGDSEKGRVSINGNWLLGTSTDLGQRLQVSGAGYFTSGLTSATSFLAISHYFYNGGGVNDIFASTNGNGAGSGNFAIVNSVNTANTAILGSINGSFRIGTNGQTASTADRFFVNLNTGFTGIGTTSPLELLNILGTGDTKLLVETTKVGTDGNSALQLKTASDGNWIVQAGNAVSGGLRFVQVGFGEIGRFSSSGNLLVGTSVDTGQKLIVNGNTLLNGILQFTTSGVIQPTLQRNGSSGGLTINTTNTASNANLFELQNNSVNYFSILASTGAATFIGSVTATSTQYSAIGTGGTYFVNGSGTGANMVFGINGSTGSIIQSRDGTSNSYPLLLQPYGGNVGIGVTPSAWNSTFNVMQIGSTGSIYSRTSGTEQMGVVSNGYFSSGTNDWRYISSTNASYYLQSGGVHYWLNAASGTAGNPITFTQAMTLTASGNLLIGSTTDPGQKLYLNGSLRIDGQRSGTAGGASGQHLIINCDGTTYKIALLNP